MDRSKDAVEVHIGVERFHISGDEEPGRVYGRVAYFINKVVGIFNIGGVWG